VSDFPDDRFLAFCTRNGLIKKTCLSAYGNVRTKGIKAIKLEDDDELVETHLTTGEAELIIATREGQACRFSEGDVRSTGRDTMGVKGITLNTGDSVVAMATVSPDDMLLTVTGNGYGKISSVDDYRKTRRGGKGVITIKTGGRNGDVVAVRKVNPTDELMITSKQGKIIRIKVADIRITGRNAMGVRVMNLHDDDLVMALEPVVGGSGEEESNEGT
jgi:DNA gyrase subunit A